MCLIFVISVIRCLFNDFCVIVEFAMSRRYARIYVWCVCNSSVNVCVVFKFFIIMSVFSVFIIFDMCNLECFSFVRARLETRVLKLFSVVVCCRVIGKVVYSVFVCFFLWVILFNIFIDVINCIVVFLYV